MEATLPIDLSRLARRFKLNPAQVEAAVHLLEEGNTPSFIARYRKDATDGLDESQLRALRTELTRAQQLAHRKESVRRTIQAQSRLTDELAAKIDKARDLRHVEDLFLPFQAQKDALATAARERGLGPLAEEVLAGDVSRENLETRAADFIDADRQLKSVADVLLGVGHILAEDLSDTASLRGALRKIYRDRGQMVSTRIETAAETEVGATEAVPAETASSEVATTEKLETPTEASAEPVVNVEAPPADEAEAAPAETSGETEGAADSPAAGDVKQEAAKSAKSRKRSRKNKRRQADKKAKQFSEFFQFKQPLSKLKPHQILTINRGDQADVLNVTIEVDREQLAKTAEEQVIDATHPHADFLRGCLKDALDRLLPASLEQDVRRDLTDKAEEHAIDVFASNLRNLLLQPPVAGKRILAIDPSFKSGCRMAALDDQGQLLAHGTLHIVGNKDRLAESRAQLVTLVREHAIDAIAIGNGPASRETEQIIAELFESELSAEVDADKLAYLIVNKGGAGDYAASQIGREELPDVEASVRAAAFIGRRLIDPLAELVKVDPACIGQGLLPQDIKGADLSVVLSEVVESSVNHVGVDLNRASASLLRYVAGLNPLIARRLFEHRQEHGPFASRQQLFDVTGFSEDSFTQAAGFLRIPDAVNPFDAAWIHPESYELAEQVRSKLETGGQDAASNGHPDAVAMAEQLGAGTRTVRDIVLQLKQPGRDPRADHPAPIFRKRALKVEDLNAGMDLRATVLNVTDFGVFVDIGLKDSALVHVSQISANYVSDPHKIVAVGDTVQVWIKAIDSEKGRVTLTMIHPGAERTPRGGRPRRRSQGQGGASGGGAGRGKPRRDGKKPRNQRSGGADRSTPRRERKPKPVVPITDDMLKGDEPMRTFGDLKQFVDAQDEGAQDEGTDGKGEKSK